MLNTHSTRKIFFHCGLPKTGTTSIQKIFWDNREKLIENKILYPNPVLSQEEPLHQFPVNSLLKDGDFSHLSAALEDAERRKCNVVVISSENISVQSHRLVLSPHIEKFHELLSGWEVELIVYMRPADSWLRSFYRQRVLNMQSGEDSLFKSIYWWYRRNNPRMPESLFLKTMITRNALWIEYEEFSKLQELHVLLNKDAISSRLTDIFGISKINFVSYSRDVVKDFCRIVGVNDDYLVVGDRSFNSMPDDSYVEFIRCVNSSIFSGYIGNCARSSVQKVTLSNHTELIRATKIKCSIFKKIIFSFVAMILNLKDMPCSLRNRLKIKASLILACFSSKKGN